MATVSAIFMQAGSSKSSFLGPCNAMCLRCRDRTERKYPNLPLKCIAHSSTYLSKLCYFVSFIPTNPYYCPAPYSLIHISSIVYCSKFSHVSSILSCFKFPHISSILPCSKFSHMSSILPCSKVSYQMFLQDKKISILPCLHLVF